MMLTEESKCNANWVDNIFDLKDFRSAVRSVQWDLIRTGFQRGKRTCSICVNPEHVAWRDACLRKILENQSKPEGQRLTEVYADESYIHH